MDYETLTLERNESIAHADTQSTRVVERDDSAYGCRA